MPDTVTAAPICVAPPLGQELVVETKNVIVPVGLFPPERVAPSEVEPPRFIEFESSDVVSVGAAFVVTVSGSQALVTGLLLASPL